MALSHHEILNIDRGQVKLFFAGGGPPMEVVPAGGTTDGKRSFTVSDNVVFMIEVVEHLEAPNGPHAEVSVDTYKDGKIVSTIEDRLNENGTLELEGGSYVHHAMA